ncbi:MAG: hypothetical protein HC908_09170 [Calothrix sp. SM1_7_51]|nr:hypothetical protein [Calothrix sp. SM1_7_51]
MIAQIHMGVNFTTIFGFLYIIFAFIYLVLLSKIHQSSKFIFIFNFFPFLVQVLPFITNNYWYVLLLVAVVSLPIFSISIFKVFQGKEDTFTRSLELLLVPQLIIYSGFVLIFHGWLLDPSLQLMVLFVSMIISYFCLKNYMQKYKRRKR